MKNSLFTSSFRLVMKRVIAIALLIACAGGAWSCYCKIVQYPRNSFYEFNTKVNNNTVDVLCVGSSHMYCGINPVQLWEDYGIAAYDLAAGSQGIWFSYFYIKEAMKTQNPKVVVLDAYTVPTRVEYFPPKARANFLNMPLSNDKWKALEVAEDEEKWDTFWRFPVTHTRYNLLKKNDFNPWGNMDNSFLGYHYESRIVPYEPGKVLDVKYVTETSTISEKAETYLRKTIELCQKEGVQVILMNAPWPDITKERQEQYNYVQQIADEYEIPFFNGCLLNEEVGMDYTVDSMGDWGHLNYSGVTKWTRYIGDYLSANYDLPDHRGDKTYEVWEQETVKLNARIRKDELAKAESMDDVARTLGDLDGLCLTIEYRGNYQRDDTELPQFNLGESLDVSAPGTYIIRNGEVIDYADGTEKFNFVLYLKNSVLNVNNKEGNKGITLDRNSYSIVKNGINILVYDEYLNEIVGKFALDADKGYEFVRR